MTVMRGVTFLLSCGLLSLAGALLLNVLRGPVPPPGDRRRRRRRTFGALVLATLAAGLLAWESIDPRTQPVPFLNVSAALLVLVAMLLGVGALDMAAVSRAERHRKLQLLTQELYGLDLKEMSGKEAEAVGRAALRRFVRQLAEARREKGEKDEHPRSQT